MKFIAPLLVIFSLTAAFAHDMDHEHDGWYKTLMMPDYPQSPCCGYADAYWCDSINVRDGATYCTITDDQDDVPLGRPHVPIGTEIIIPNHKLKWDRGNPTGHAIVFLSPKEHNVYCFVQSTGI